MLSTQKSIEFKDIYTLDFDSQYNVLKILKQLSNTIDLEDKNTIKERMNKLTSYLIENKQHRILIIYYNSEIIGSITIFIEPKIIHNFRNVCHVEDFVIDKQYRGLGLGCIVLDKIYGLATQNDCYKIILDCNDDVIHFYEKCGYKNTNNQMSFYTF